MEGRSRIHDPIYKAASGTLLCGQTKEYARLVGQEEKFEGAETIGAVSTGHGG